MDFCVSSIYILPSLVLNLLLNIPLLACSNETTASIWLIFCLGIGTHIVQFPNLRKQIDEEHMKTQLVQEKPQKEPLKHSDCLRVLLAQKKYWFEGTDSLAKAGCVFIRSSLSPLPLSVGFHPVPKTVNVQKNKNNFFFLLKENQMPLYVRYAQGGTSPCSTRGS